MGYDFDYKIVGKYKEKYHDISRHNHYLNKLVFCDERQFTFHELFEVILSSLLELKESNDYTQRENIAGAIGILTKVLGNMEEKDTVIISYC